MATELLTTQTQNATSDPRDVEYWSRHCKPVLKSLLKSAGSYSEDEQEAQLRLLCDHVLPNLGPRPSRAPYPSFITQTGSPFQPQINISNNKPRIRYCWEPLGPRGGSESDPYGVEAAREIVSSLSKSFGFYSQWNDTFVDAFAPSPEQVRDVQEKLPKWLAKQMPPGVEPPLVRRLPFSFIAFELKDAKASIKTYFNPKAKELATGIPATEITWSALRNLKPSLNPASIDAVAKFLAEREVPSAVELVGIDCVDEADLSEARVKLYVHTRDNSFNTVRDYVTLGGRITDETTLEGLGVLRELWHMLLQKPEGIPDEGYDAPFSDKEGFAAYQKLYFGFELRPSRELPEVKSYLPTWHYVKSDDVAVDNYEEVFRRCGQDWGHNSKYRKMFEEAFGPANHDRKVPVHCDASFMYSKTKGAYQSLYYSPTLEIEA
uniref:Aromatic prenyl transferase-like protein n=1 Tax=Epichloe aotearoae TaxID=170559 RepID=R9UNL1_EPIAO|nr:aromatic prenyl transferase-like protein [Epichloe aotearoae]